MTSWHDRDDLWETFRPSLFGGLEGVAYDQNARRLVAVAER